MLASTIRLRGCVTHHLFLQSPNNNWKSFPESQFCAMLNKAQYDKKGTAEESETSQTLENYFHVTLLRALRRLVFECEHLS